MIKLIIFDLSDVCFSLEEPPFIKEFAEKHGIDYEEFDKTYQEMLVKAEVDELTGEYVWEQLGRIYNIKIDVKKAIADMMAMKVPYQAQLDLAKELRKGYKTAYLTNYNKAYWDVIRKKFDLSPYFDFGVVSYQIKARKPAPKGFLLIMERFKAKPEETIFVDDSEKNLVKAAELGINTIHFKSTGQLVKDLKALGVVI